MIHNASKFCQAGGTVLGTCCATSWTAETCLKLPEHRWFVGLEKDSAFFQNTLASPVKVYAKGVLRPNYGIYGNRGATEASKVFVKLLTSLASMSEVDTCTVPL